MAEFEWEHGPRVAESDMVRSAAMGLSDDSGQRKAILGASLELGGTHGLDGLTMRGIARKLGVSATALYQHFGSKIEILRAIRFRGLLDLNERLRPAFALDDPRERLREQALGYLRFAQEKPWLYCLLLVDDADDWGVLSATEQDTVMESSTLVKQAIRDGMERGLLRPDLDPDIVSTTMWAAMHGLALLILRGRISPGHPVFPVENIDAASRRFVDELVRGLEVPRPRDDD